MGFHLVVWYNTRMAVMKISNQEVLVDDNMLEELSKWGWWVTKAGYVLWQQCLGKVAGKYRYKNIFMHRLVASTPDGKITDHINGNKLDNRKENLRVCTHKGNNSNSKLFSTNSSGYRGVSRIRSTGKWRSTISVDNKSVNLGHFESPVEAALAYNEAAREYHGEFAKVNKVW